MDGNHSNTRRHRTTPTSEAALTEACVLNNQAVHHFLRQRDCLEATESPLAVFSLLEQALRLTRRHVGSDSRQDQVDEASHCRDALPVVPVVFVAHDTTPPFLMLHESVSGGCTEVAAQAAALLYNYSLACSLHIQNRRAIALIRLAVAALDNHSSESCACRLIHDCVYQQWQRLEATQYSQNNSTLSSHRPAPSPSSTSVTFSSSTAQSLPSAHQPSHRLLPSSAPWAAGAA